MFRSQFNRNMPVNDLFNGHYVAAGNLYVTLFNRIPNMLFIPEMNTGQVFKHVQEKYGRAIRDILQHSYFHHNEKQVYFNNTIFVLREKRLIELADSYAQILYAARDFEWANTVMRELVEFKTEPVPVKETRIIGFARENQN